ncbi:MULTISPECIES: hypothetical protein [Mycolicibacter]|uniref:Uncharacterized protein n=1 Tax=Mycolicibacter kumamotonensis TaxID=354243 RepID=A0A7K3L6W6_9MYCO|nr:MULTISPECIES: hypothetical protein [Mycolicibacter]NDJ88138.1 hypothetical protein [Mycolicibacter kumamotonensis]RAV03851.1 hypothetical protein DQP56_01215 [Mycolicibacter senuensis]
MSAGNDEVDEVIQHDRLSEEADLLTTLEASARVREVLRDTRRELAQAESNEATDLELTVLREKITQLEVALQRYR